MKRVITAVLAAIFLLPLMPVTGIAAPSAPNTVLGWVYIVNTTHDRCIAASGGDTTQGTAAVLWTCNGGNEQKWYISGIGRSTLRYGKGFGMCLAIPNGSSDTGVRPIIWPCSTGQEQLWVGFAAQGTPIVNVATSKCLDGYRYQEGLVLQWECDRTIAQDWDFVRAPAP